MAGNVPAPRILAATAMLVMAVAMALVPARADQAVIQGAATVIDADTIDIGTTRIRLWGIDAPERDQTCSLGKLIYHCGQLAADELAAFLDGRTVRCRRKDTDRHGRIVAVCHASTGQDIAAWEGIFMTKRSIGNQIEEVARILEDRRNTAKGMRGTDLGRMQEQILRLECALTTLQWVRDNNDVIRHLTRIRKEQQFERSRDEGKRS